jgi:hypothetical protein
MDMAVISEGQVIILGHWLGRSRFPLMMASMMDGWSEPRLTKQFLTPDYW